MPQLPIDHRENTMRAQSTSVQAQGDTAIMAGAQRLAKGIMQTGQAAEASRQLKLVPYVNELQRGIDLANKKALSEMDDDGSNYLDLFETGYDSFVSETPLPKGLGDSDAIDARNKVAEKLKNQKSEIMGNMVAINKKHQTDLYKNNVGDLATRVINDTSFDNWDAVDAELQENTKLWGTAINASPEQMTAVYEEQLNGLFLARLDAMSGTDIESAQEVIEGINSGKVAGFDKSMLKGQDPNKLQAVKNNAVAYVDRSSKSMIKNGTDLVAAGMRSVDDLRSPNINIEELKSQFSILPAQYQPQANKVIAQAQQANAFGEVMELYGRSSNIDVDRIRNEATKSIDASDLDEKTKEGMQNNVNHLVTALTRMQANRQDNPFDESVRINPQARGMLSEIAQIEQAIEEVPVGEEKRAGELQALLTEKRTEYGNEMRATAEHMLGNEGFVAFESKERKSKFLKSLEFNMAKGNSEQVIDDLNNKVLSYGEQNAPYYIGSTFDAKESEKWAIVASVIGDNRQGAVDLVDAMRKFDDHKEKLGASVITSITADVDEQIAEFAKTFPDQERNQTLQTMRDLMVKLAVHNKQTPGKVQYTSMFGFGNSDNADAAVSAAKVLTGGYRTLDTVRVPQLTAAQYPSMQNAITGIGERPDVFARAILKHTNINQIQPTAGRDENSDAEFADQEMKFYTSDQGDGVAMTVGPLNRPVLKNDGSVLVIPWETFNALGEQAPASRSAFEGAAGVQRVRKEWATYSHVLDGAFKSLLEDAN